MTRSLASPTTKCRAMLAVPRLAPPKAYAEKSRLSQCTNPMVIAASFNRRTFDDMKRLTERHIIITIQAIGIAVLVWLSMGIPLWEHFVQHH